LNRFPCRRDGSEKIAGAETLLAFLATRPRPFAATVDLLAQSLRLWIAWWRLLELLASFVKAAAGEVSLDRGDEGRPVAGRLAFGFERLLDTVSKGDDFGLLPSGGDGSFHVHKGLFELAGREVFLRSFGQGLHEVLEKPLPATVGSNACLDRDRESLVEASALQRGARLLYLELEVAVEHLPNSG